MSDSLYQNFFRLMKFSQFASIFLAFTLVTPMAKSNYAEVEGNISMLTSSGSQSASDSHSAIATDFSVSNSTLTPVSLGSDTIVPNDSTRRVMRIGSAEGSGTDFKPQLEFERLVVPPSPEVSDMLRHLDEEMDYSAGAATITVPLYSWQSGDIAINLAMRHRTGSFRKDDRGGWTGLGWDLQGGGVIARTVCGMPDEDSDMNIRTVSSIRGDSNADYFKQLHKHEYDGDQDRFSWSCPAGSGSFIVIDGRVEQTPVTNNLIELIGNLKDSNSYFLITAPDGMQYYFSIKEYLDVEYRSQNLSNDPCQRSSSYYNIVSAWHLTKIVAPYGESAVFSYDSIPSWKRTEASELRTYTTHSIESSGAIHQTGQSYSYPNGSEPVSRIVSTFRNQRILSKIVTRTAIAEFTSTGTYVMSAPDIPKKLSVIRIYAPQGADVRNISFTHINPKEKKTQLTKKLEPYNSRIAHYTSDINVIRPKGVERAVSEYRGLNGAYIETAGASPLLKEFTEYESRDGVYQPLLTQKYFHSKKDSATRQIGVYYEPVVIDKEAVSTINGGAGTHIVHDWQSTSDFTYGEINLTHFNTVVDSIQTIRHFPSGGTRTSVKKIIYSAPDASYSQERARLIILPFDSINANRPLTPFPNDTLKLRTTFLENDIRIPFGEVICENGHKLEHYTARVLNLQNHSKSPWSCGRTDWNYAEQLDLPIAEMWVVDGRDTILKKIEYAKFYSALRPVRSELLVSSINKKRSRLSLQRTWGYTQYGKPVFIEQTGQPRISMPYCADPRLSDYPSFIKIGDPSQQSGSLIHTTSFTYEPLVGCTSVTAPDGSTTEYGYLGGRLVSKSDAEGGDLQKWSYSLLGENASAGDGHSYSYYTYKGFNSIIEKSLPDAAPGSIWDETKASEKRQYYDGYGLPVISMQKGFGNVSGILSTNSQNSLSSLNPLNPLNNLNSLNPINSLNNLNSLNSSPACDVIQVTRRDALHRVEKVWNSMGWDEDIEELFSQSSSDTNNLFWSDTPLTNKSQSIWNDDKGYIKNTYPISVEEQPSSTALQGESFSQHPTKTEYECSRTDVAKYKVVKLSFDGTNLKGKGYYGDGELDCTHITDGNGAETLTFTDFMGRTVLMRKSAEGGGYSDTYSVYDSWGRPLIVLPPECSARIVTSTMNRTVSDKTISDFAFIYTYDNKLRLKSKKLPGCNLCLISPNTYHPSLGYYLKFLYSRFYH